MNRYDYSDIKKGMRESFETAVTGDMMDKFRLISGDKNPLHTDGNYAAEKGFQGCVVYGMLAAAFYSRLVGEYLPGERCLLQRVDVKFRQPVFVGDRLTVSGEVADMNDTFRQLTVRGEMRNQNGVKVNTAVIKAGML